MDSEKARKAFSAVKIDIEKINSKLEKVERISMKKPQKDKEIDQLLSILQSLKAETFENTKRIEALNTLVHGNSSKQENISYQKDIEELRTQIEKLEVKKNSSSPAAPTTVNSVNDQKIENTFNEFSEIMNEKMQIEMNSLRLEFTEEIAKLYDKCFNEILNLKAQVDKQESSSPRTPKAKTKPEKKEEKQKKESKMKKISKFLFVDEDEDELASVKKQVEDKK